ncbi:hypothetical protein FA15DRAFT_651200 [Coprinopsis marcescibilis]|uniref:SprT-like domain-containing protein n=1 Tax=Coprinopsis marcescibilis TaxID=230819 RepID=A0A5C3LDF3_COPMA|nr:hypothetical protein FA15DRAFT_651200 [Coprinopsis marcescibilis]
MRSRIIESSDSDSSDEESPGPPTKLSLKLASTTWNQPVPKADPKVLLEKTSAVNTVIEDEDDDTDAILVLLTKRLTASNEPKSARKPLPSHSIARSLAGDTTSKPSQATSDAPTASTSCKIGTPSRTPAKGTPRTSKKKTQAEQQKKLQDYADALFKELNGTVFNGGLPDDTKLNWNKRLLTTAGRAKWHRYIVFSSLFLAYLTTRRSRDGVASSEIELAEKILTSFERIRNTLSHEMCHLASWVIDKEIKEGHGRIWKAWTRRVMSKYPNIEISTRHDYEIDYPFQWKCGKCAKIYGRFSKSIKTEECVCGACKVGRLVPQFETNTRTHRTQIMSRMASVKGQGKYLYLNSPCRSPIQTSVKPPVIICISSDSEDDEPTIGRPTKATCCDIDGAGTDSDSEVEVLAMVLQSTSISSA